eukprot:15887127-Heterocapsa_arctica.AAC.1
MGKTMDEAIVKIQEAIDKFKNDFNDKVDALMQQKEGINGTFNDKRVEGQEMKGNLQNMIIMRMAGEMGKIMNHMIRNMDKIKNDCIAQ